MDTDQVSHVSHGWHLLTYLSKSRFDWRRCQWGGNRDSYTLHICYPKGSRGKRTNKRDRQCLTSRCMGCAGTLHPFRKDHKLKGVTIALL